MKNQNIGQRCGKEEKKKVVTPASCRERKSGV